jgi:hypothetical protein
MMHPDYEKILADFKAIKGEEEGQKLFDLWIKKMSLDPDKPYRKKENEESFKWAEKTIKMFKEEEYFKLYKVEALFPVTSMNRNVYTEDELLRSARTLVGKVPNINHTGKPMKGCLIIGAEYESRTVECLLQVDKEAKSPWEFLWTQHLDEDSEVPEEHHMIHVSIEANCLSGRGNDGECKGLVFSGIAGLTKETLPGVPLTRILPVEILNIESILTELSHLEDEEPNMAENQLEELSERVNKLEEGFKQIEGIINELKEKLPKEEAPPEEEPQPEEEPSPCEDPPSNPTEEPPQDPEPEPEAVPEKPNIMKDAEALINEGYDSSEAVKIAGLRQIRWLEKYGQRNQI